MRVIKVSRYGGPELLRLAEWPDPTPIRGTSQTRRRRAAREPRIQAVTVGSRLRPCRVWRNGSSGCVVACG
jgi:hypothetical protein